MLGEKMISYFEQGKMAANLVLDIFNGTPVNSIKMITKSPNKYIFDYKIIKKYFFLIYSLKLFRMKNN